MPLPRFAVLDVEATSGDPTNGHVLEVAVLAFDGRAESMRWESMVDPRVPIPPFIRRLTGIDEASIVGAPTFPMVVGTLQALTRGRIVVAHNVRYDMTALEHEFARTGLVFERRTLCTERTGRRLLPHLGRHNLGSLCHHFGIPFKTRHRAGSDAEATSLLLFRLMDAFGQERVLEGVTAWSTAVNGRGPLW